MKTPSREDLAAVNEAAADYYRTHLLNTPGPQSYLSSRGFAHLLQDTAWTIGYAPAGWTNLRDHLYRQGYDEQILLASGLCLQSRYRTTIDRFRERITFGIRDQQGTLVGFTARSAPGAPATVPRYLNTPTTLLYDKSSVLFGLGECATKLQAGGVVVVAEGPLDALAVDHASPHHGALAVCGTALTGAHTAFIRSSRTLIAFDGDTAGLRASAQAYTLLAHAAHCPQTVQLTGGFDPAELLRVHGPDALAHALRVTIPLADRVIDATLHGRPDLATNAETQIAAARAGAHAINTLNPRDVARQVARVADATQLPSGTITDEVVDAAHRTPRAPHAGARRRTSSLQA